MEECATSHNYPKDWDYVAWASPHSEAFGWCSFRSVYRAADLHHESELCCLTCRYGVDYDFQESALLSWMWTTIGGEAYELRDCPDSSAMHCAVEVDVCIGTASTYSTS